MLVEKTPRVSVCVVTYNHEKYIRKCLQSLIDQSVDFDFEILVADDCSNDCTQEIIIEFSARYPQRIRAFFHEKNMGAIQNYIFVHGHAVGEYIAHMDGDDYALAGKLQAQSDHLDAHPECVIVWHRMKVLDSANNRVVNDLVDVNIIPKNGFSRGSLISIGSVACHSSKMYRASVRPMVLPSVPLLDFFVDVEQLEYGFGQYINLFLGVYRANVGVSSDGLKTRALLIANLALIFELHPSCRRFVCAHLFRLVMGDLLHRRPTVKKSMLEFSRAFHPMCVIDFFALRKYTRIFRSPL